MPASKSIRHLDPSMTAPWTQPEPLPNIPGGETNLLQRTAWADPLNPLRLKFKPWYDVPPTIPGTEQIDVFLGNNEGNIIATRTWNLPMSPDDHFIEITADKLPQGEHQISFIMTNFLDVAARSFPYTVTIDKQEPMLNASSRLTFPAALLPPNKLTARYLEQNNDEVKAGLPAYTTPRPGDRITWYWGATAGNLEQGGTVVLDEKSFSAPIILTIPGQLIRDRRDGFRYVWYQVEDRAENASLRSDPVELDVAATPIPRTLPPIKVAGATGSAASGTLNPSNAINGATVVIPADAVIYDGESVFVQWGEPGNPGAYRTGTPITPGSGEYRIPVEKVSYHIAKSLLVRYEVVEPGVVDPHNSQAYTLRVEMFGGPPTIQCDRISGGRLSLASIPAGGFANFTLDRWTWMATDQFITVSVVGVDTSNQSLTIPVLTGSPVPEVAQRISVGRISKTDLQRYKLNLGIEIRCSVSFDGKQSYQSFPRLTPTLVA
ncbi:hypothetical protein [Pseudomonas mohnii]|uniref:hypothetical protein n=1 Tax=Pseudomonas mohnii TaxID=395600 RepID=UPI0018DDE395|nr:hypothetical protein [Pseudomonas mohnii]MBH8610047.1 hypothetical protein [Pseudomonas mohnii]